MSVERIRYLLERSAEKPPPWLDNGIEWEVCREIAEEMAGGKSARQLAQEIGKSRRFVEKNQATWRDFHDSIPPGLGESIDGALTHTTPDIWANESNVQKQRHSLGSGKTHQPPDFPTDGPGHA
jgi:hypothetical protein